MNISINFCEFNQDKVNQLWDDLDLRAFSQPSSEPEFDIKDGLQKSDQERMLSEITRKDMEFIVQSARANFSENFNLQNEEILAWLFQAALGVKIEDEDFFLNNAVTGIPLALWVQLFQQMPPQAMENLKVKCKKANYSFEKFREYLLGIKSVVKYCLDNQAQMISFYDGGTSGIMRDRAMKIYKRLMPDKAVAV